MRKSSYFSCKEVQNYTQYNFLDPLKCHTVGVSGDNRQNAIFASYLFLIGTLKPLAWSFNFPCVSFSKIIYDTEKLITMMPALLLNTVPMNQYVNINFKNFLLMLLHENDIPKTQLSCLFKHMHFIYWKYTLKRSLI